MRALLSSLKFRSVAFTHPVEAEVPQLNGVDLAAVYFGERIGGDLCDFIRVSPSRVLFGLLDVAGRVEENHAIVAAAKATFRSVGSELLAAEDTNETDAMIEISLRLNRAILAAADGVRSCPAFAGCYNEGLGTVCYFNAGHTAGLAMGGTGITELRATGLPLGLFSHSPSDASMVALERGASMLLVSRGVVEAKRKSDEFGLDGVKGSLERRRGESTRNTCLAVLDDAREFTRGRAQNDMTALALARQS